MEQVSVSEFLILLERVRQTGEPIEILENGQPLAVLYPAPPKDRNSALGSMKWTLSGPVGDLIEPVAQDEWEALRD